MSKYIIEIAEEYEEYFKGVLICGIVDGKFAVDVIAREDLEELNSDYINEHYGELQDEAYKRGYDDGYEAGCATAFKPVSDAEYQRGLNDAWEAAKKIALMDTETSENVTGYFGLFRIMENLTPMQAIEKLKAYDDKQKDRIEVGDIVDRYIDGKFDSRGIYLGGNGEIWDCLFWANTLPITLAYPKGQFKKTGKHYDIASILEAMRT